ncbi:MAG: hypothetical protein VX539_00670 [Thermoproteota archaeon]|nr:hypothetical protein [Thermoproteota archaeon]
MSDRWRLIGAGIVG